MIRAAALALLCLAAAFPARAQDGPVLSGTLAAVNARGTLRLGVRDSAVPFAFRNAAGQAVGFSVDLCRGVAADVAQALHRDLLEADAPAWQDGLRVAFVPVTADTRLPGVTGGAVDLECGSTTDTAERRRSVAFSPVFFLAGTKLLAASPVASYRDLAGRRVAVAAGTTNAAVLHGLAARLSPPATVTEVPDVAAAYAALAGGQADAMASDDVLLAGQLAAHPGERRFAVVGDYLSFEPYAVMFRRDDPAFAALVLASFQRMAADGTLARRYARWFTDRLPSGQTLDLPMGAQLTEMYRALGQPD